MKNVNEINVDNMNKMMLIETPQNISSYMALQLAIMNCTYSHQIENLIDMYESTCSNYFSREEHDSLILMFYNRIDKFDTTKNYKHICELKLRVISKAND